MEETASHWHFIEAKAAELGVGAEAIRKWRERGKVPDRWRLPLLDAADADGRQLPREIFDNVPAKPEGAAA